MNVADARFNSDWVTLDFTSTKTEQVVNFKENSQCSVFSLWIHASHSGDQHLTLLEPLTPLTLVISMLHSGSPSLLSLWLSACYTPAASHSSHSGDQHLTLLQPLTPLTLVINTLHSCSRPLSLRGRPRGPWGPRRPGGPQRGAHRGAHRGAQRGTEQPLGQA